MPLDYSGQNLRGRNFRGKNLEGANFSGADIRSADFTGANLKGANFNLAKAGLKKRWATFLVLVSLVLMGLPGILSTLTGSLTAYLLFYAHKDSYQVAHIIGWTFIVLLFIFFFATIRQGIQAGLGAITVTVTVVAVLDGAVAGAETFAELFHRAGARPFAEIVAGGVAFAATVTGGIVFISAVGGAGVVAFVFAFTFFEVVAVAIAFTVGGAGAEAVAVTVGVVFAVAYAHAGAIAYAHAGAIAFTVSFAFLLLSTYISRRALKGDPKHALIRNIVIAFAAIGGTSFRNADLTNANFTNASLKSTDFRKANLTRTCFHNTKKIDRTRPGSTYLQKVEVRDVLVKGLVQNNNFEHLNLRGVNFKGASLIDASFIGADLSEANLQDADLSRAKLVQAQLDGTDFTGATLTGAYIKDWNITSDTNFNGVRCEYVYMQLPTRENPDPYRKPDNREEVFADGEFGDFIKPIVDTLDLYHNQGVDPRAIAISFKELAENNPSAELEIVSVERRGEDKILLRAKTAATANKSELSKEYFINYNQLKALAENDYRILITNQKIQIRNLTNMIKMALKRPRFYAENYHNQGDTIMPEGSKQQFNNNLQSAQFAGGLVNADKVEAGQIGGNITNYTQEQKQNLAQAAAEIQQLLYQLSSTNPITNEAVTEAIYQEIRRNPTLKARLQSALKAGGLEALKAIFNHPLFSIPAETIKGWLEAE